MGKNLYDIEGTFYRFCDSTTKKLKVSDLDLACRGLNFQFNDELLEMLLEAVNLDPLTSSPIDLEKFEEVVTVAMNFFDESQHYLQLFKLLDTGNKGYLDLKDLQKIRDQLEPNLLEKEIATDQELLDMISVAQQGPYSRQNLSNESNSLPQLRWNTQLDSQISLKQFCKLLDKLQHGE